MPKSNPHKIVVLGGGFGGLHTALSLKRWLRKRDDVQLFLINEKNYFQFTPLLHEVATGSVAPDNVVHPLRELIRGKHMKFVRGEVKKINFSKREVHFSNNMIRYDTLVVALGSRTNFYGIPGAQRYSLTLRSLADSSKIKKKIICNLEAAMLEHRPSRQNSLMRIVIVGGGPSGVELAAEIKDLLDQLLPLYGDLDHRNSEILLIDKKSALMAGFGAYFANKALEILQKRGITVKLGTKVEGVSAQGVEVREGYRMRTYGRQTSLISSKLIIWTGGVTPNKVEMEPEPEFIKGRIGVTAALQHPDFEEVFVVGDQCCPAGQQRPPDTPVTAWRAIQQGRHTARNIVKRIEKRPTEEFYYRHRGYVVSLGNWQALADLRYFKMSGFFAWILYRLVHLSKTPGLYNQIRIGMDWVLDMFFPRESSE